MPRVLAQKDYFPDTVRRVRVTALVEEEEFEHYAHTVTLFGYINESQYSVQLEFGCGEQEWKQVFERCNAELCRTWLKQQHEFFRQDVPEAMWALLNAPAEEQS